MNAQQQLIAEMRSTASSLRLNGVTANTIHKIAAELIDRAADAMDLMYTPAQMAESFRAGLNTARMESHPPAPGWETAPSGYNFRAMDSDGRWSWFKDRPYRETFSGWDGWDSEEGIREARGLRFYPGWQETLEERAEVT